MERQGITRNIFAEMRLGECEAPDRNIDRANSLYKERQIRHLKRKRSKALTICIASICELSTGNPRIVFCADRLVTDANGLTFEQATPKIVQLLPNCLIMNAGDACHGDIIVRDVFSRLNQLTPDDAGKLTIKGIVEMVRERVIAERNEAIETELFAARGIDRRTFYSNFRSFQDWFALMVDTSVTNYSLDVSFIILGFDISQEPQSVGVNLYEVRGNGEIQFDNPIGFSIVGIGSYQSLPEITKEPYSPNTTLSDSLVRTFWAKKLSERMVSVGRETTDLGIMFVELDPESKKLVAKNTLLLDDFKNKVLSKAFEHQRKMLRNMTTKVQRNVAELLQGKKTIGKS